MKEIRRIRRGIPRDHALAAELWNTGIHEARILAALVDEPAKVTPAQMDRWIRDFDAWDVCDQVCMNLFDRTPHAWTKALEWSTREPEFERRAAYALMASLAVHAKDAPDAAFVAFFPAIRAGAEDDRNFVRKAVSWGLRQIGKRNAALGKRALAEARRLEASENKAARWVGRDATRELGR